MPRQIHIVFNLLALFIITYILVDMFYNVFSIKLYNIGAPKVVALKDVANRGDEVVIPPEYAMIEERNIFGATKEVAPPPVEEKVEQVELLQETSLQLSLLGTIAGDTESARAIILDERTRSQDIYKVGDAVQEAVIRHILRGKVILRHAGKDEILIMVEGEGKTREPPVAQQRGRPASRARNVPRDASQEEAAGEIEVETVAIDQELLQSSMSDLNALMTQVRVRPYFRQGIPEGLIVSQIQPDSIFEKMGFMNGDIIASVNGKQMSTPEEAFQLYNSLQSGAAVSIEITRRGQKRMLTYQIQ